MTRLIRRLPAALLAVALLSTVAAAPALAQGGANSAESIPSARTGDLAATRVGPASTQQRGRHAAKRHARRAAAHRAAPQAVAR